MARESDSRLKLEDSGTFVIFAAIYAAGTLGLPTISLPAYQVKILEMASPFVALFGMPAVLGLTLGQFITNLSLQARPISMLSPIFSFVGLLAIYYMRKRSTLAGSLAYIVITGLWLSLTLPIAKLGVSSSLATLGIRWSVRRGNGGIRSVSLDDKDYDNCERPADAGFCDYPSQRRQELGPVGSRRKTTTSSLCGNYFVFLSFD